MDIITSNHPDAQKFAEQVQRLLTLSNQLPATTPLPSRMVSISNQLERSILELEATLGHISAPNTATAIRAQKKKERRQRKRAKTEGEREKGQAQAQSAQVKKERLNVQQERRTTRKLADSPPAAIATSLPDHRLISEPTTANSPIDISSDDSEPCEVDDNKKFSTMPRPVLPDGDIAFYCIAEGLQEILEGLDYCFGLEYLWLKTGVHSLHAKLQSMSRADFADPNNPHAFEDEQRRLTDNFTIWRLEFRDKDLETVGAQALKSTWPGLDSENWSHEVTLSRQRPQEGQPGLEVKLRTSVWSGNFKYGTWWITSMRAIDDVEESICVFIGVDHDVGDRMASEMRDPEAW